MLSPKPVMNQSNKSNLKRIKSSAALNDKMLAKNMRSHYN